jgi:hypothetical protein
MPRLDGLPILAVIVVVINVAVPGRVDDAHTEVALESELKDILKSYRGWAGRRNDIAHG